MPKGIYKGHNWHKPTEEDFINYYSLHSSKETAEYFETSVSSIIRLARKLGVSKPVSHGYKKGSKELIIDKLPDDIKNQIYSDYQKGEMVNFLVKKYNLNWKQISQVLGLFGVENPARKISELSESVREEFLRKRRESHYLKTGSYKFEITEEHKNKISKTREANKLKNHESYSKAQKALVAKGYRPFGDNHALRQSKVNDKIFETLKSKGIICQREVKIGNYFYDFGYNKTLIEINPTITHNITKDFSEIVTGKKPKEKKIYKKYHYDRWVNAKENGYELVSWFGWMDINRFINFLIKRIKGFSIRVMARKMKIALVDPKEANIFFERNHLLGPVVGNSINFGLYSQSGDLLQIMSFGKPRNSDKAQYELLRLATESEYQVVGGASKLLSTFIEKYNPESIITYADNNLGLHTIYEKIGFKLISDNSISATWHKPESRRKSKVIQGIGLTVKESSLLKQGADRLLKNLPGYFRVGLDYSDFIKRGGKEEYAKEYLEHTEEGWWPGNNDIMVHNKFYKVYDCGYSTYLLTLGERALS